MFVCSNAASSYDLIEIHKLATENDPVLRAAEAARQAEYQAKPQSRAQLLPLINFNAEIFEGRERIIDSPFVTATGETTSFDSNSISLSLTQTLYNREFFLQLNQADISVARAEADYQAAQQDLIIRVAQAYFTLLAAGDNLEFVTADKEAIGRQLEQAKQRFDVGLVAITDVHEAQAAYDLANAEEIEAVNLLQSSEEALFEITAELDEDLDPLMSDIPLEPPDPQDIDQWVATAMEQNFALLAARFSEEIAEEDVRLQRAGHHPQLDLVANLARTESSSSSLGGNLESEEGVIGLQFTLPLYAGGGVSSRVQEAMYTLTGAQQETERQRRATIRQTRDAYLAVIAAIDRVKALGQARVSSQSALDATEAGFEVGTRTTVDVLLARSDLLEAQRQYARARYDYIINLLLLKEAAGTLTVADLQAFNQWLEN